jgi:hypothetical protein
MSEGEWNGVSRMWSKNRTTMRMRRMELLHMETVELGQEITCERGGQG